MITYTGLLAPEETMTGDGRILAAGKGKWRTNVPVLFKDKSGGHGDAVVVGTLRGQTFAGPGGVWGTVQFMDPQVVPEVLRATYMLDQKAIGPSVDLSPEYTVEAVPHPHRPNKKAARFTDYMVVGVTLVPMPAFGEVHLSCDKESERALLASAGMDLDHIPYFDINMRAWDGWPLADRQLKYDADDAVKRIAQWAGIGTRTPSLDHYASAFLWRDGNQTGDSLAQDSFRLPLCDIIDGQPHLVYHAVYAAAALLSGGHGGLPNIPPSDQEAMKGVINNIYAKMAQAYGDSGMKSPFDPSYTNRRPESQPGMAMDTEFEMQEPYGDVKYADPGYRDNKKRYPIDTEEHIRAAWSYINQEKNAAFYDAEQLAAIKGRIKAAAKKVGIEIAEEMSLGAGVSFALNKRPSRSAFENPRLASPTRLTVDANGRVYGHLATWKECHVGVGDRCVLAPHSRTNYAYFRTGPVTLDDGTDIMVGKITAGAGHANDKWGVMPAREHYDNTAWCAAVVNIGEDRHGIWVAGVLSPTIDETQLAILRQSPLSGDWRRVNGNLELIAALAVNSPGFPVISFLDGDTFSMQSVGMVEETEPVVEPTFGIEPLEDETYKQFAARLEEIETKRQEGLVAKRAGQLEEIDAQRQAQQAAPAGGQPAAGALPAGQSQTLANSIARQMDCRFVVLPEPAGDGKAEKTTEEPALTAAPAQAPSVAPQAPTE